MEQPVVAYRDQLYIVQSQKPQQGDLFYHKNLKVVDKVTDVTPNGLFLTGTELGVCQMSNCSLVIEAQY